MPKIAKKLPKRCSRTKGAWIAIARGRDNSHREVVSRNARQGINFPAITEVGSAAYRKARKLS